jgi:hypothetical protein
MPGYNDQDSVFSEDGMSFDNRSLQSNGSIGDDHMALFDKSNMIADNRIHENSFKDQCAGVPVKRSKKRANNISTGNISSSNRGSGFLSQFDELAFDNPADPVSANGVSDTMGPGGAAHRSEMARNLALKGNYSNFDERQDMTYDVVDKNNFVHNNMVPYFKSGAGKGYGPDSIQQQKLNSMRQRKMERFTGSTKNIEYRPKTERRPLFNPHVGLTNIYGMPSYSEEMTTRYIPGKEKRNEKLHQPTKVTPGLNMGYNQVSKQGFHEDFRVLPKTIDELRAANNPQVTYTTPVVAGLKAVKRAIIPNMAKNRPETAFELDPRDMVKSLSYYRAPTVRANVDAKTTNREMTSTEWYSSAKFGDGSLPKPESMYAKQRISNKENYLMPGPRNPHNAEQNKSYAFDAAEAVPDPTNRDMTQNNNRVNAPNNSVQNKSYAFNYNEAIPDPTNRDMTQNITRVNAPNNSAQNKSYALDRSGAIPDPTNRDMTQNITRVNAPHNSVQNKGYTINDNYIPDPTLKEMVENNTRLNVPHNTAQNKGYAFNFNDNIPDPTLRELVENNTRLNVPHNSAQNKSYAFNQIDNIPDPTLRELIENNTRLNVPHNTAQNKSYAINYSDIPDPTLRELIENNTRLNAPNNSSQNKTYAVNYENMIPDPTLRDLTQNNTRLNVPHNSTQNKSYAIDYSTAVPDPTLRDLTQNNTRLNAPNNSVQNKPQAFDFVNAVPDPTNRDMTQHNTRLNAANNSSQNKSYIIDSNYVPDPTNRDMTQHNTRLNAANTSAQNKSYITDKNYIPDPTLRNLIEVNTRINPAARHGAYKETSRADIDNIQVNVAKEALITVRDGGQPVTSNYEKIPTYEHSMVRLSEPIQVNRDMYGQLPGHKNQQDIQQEYTRIANVLPQLSWHFDTMVKANLNTNPYINNTQNKSVEYSTTPNQNM